MLDILGTVAGFDDKYDGATFMSDGRSSITRAGFCARVYSMAEVLIPLPERIGILAENGIYYATAQLAGWVAGKVVVPLPLIFSPEQLGHIVRDAGLTHAVTTASTEKLAAGLGLASVTAPRSLRKSKVVPRPGAGQLVYTSGSTGTPKGVLHGIEQIDASAQMLVSAARAERTDVYLSILPLPLLLETIGAICVPLLAGARVRFDALLSATVLKGHVEHLNEAIERHKPTTTILVPELLAAWVGDLECRRVKPTSSLGMVAVGGAPVPDTLAQRAWQLGIPVYEGYGLTECCSVVTLNRPGSRKAGTVGRPLSGLDVAIDDGEIVVNGPTVMQGYLSGPRRTVPYRTGDLGALDADGYLTVHGRIDNRIASSLGRNISPEWIETMLIADPWIALAAVAIDVVGHPTVLIVPSNAGTAWLSAASRHNIVKLIAERCCHAPAYAVPKSFHVMTREAAMSQGLLTANGRLDRQAIGALARSSLWPTPPLADAHNFQLENMQ